MFGDRHKRGPGKTFAAHTTQLRTALARTLASKGITCSQCPSALHHSFIPWEPTAKELEAPWGDIHKRWLVALEEAQAANGVCKVGRRHKIATDHPYDLCSAHGGLDIPQKKQLYVELMGVPPTCHVCNRSSTTTMGFHFNHRSCKWENGDSKLYNLSDFFVNWIQVLCDGDYRKGDDDAIMRNFECLGMPFAQAEPLMRAEATKVVPPGRRASAHTPSFAR